MPTIESGIPEDAHVFTPTGRLGGKIALSQGMVYLGEFLDIEDALEYSNELMRQDCWFPDRVWVSDHGNWWFVDSEGNEIKD